VATDLSQYSGRRIDVLAWRGGTPTGEVLLAQSLLDTETAGEICTGIQKLAQRFLIKLMTKKGSRKYAPDEGTNFMLKIQQGRIRTETDMYAAFQLAELAAGRQLRAEETDADPDDERYRKTSMTALTVSPGYANVTVELKSLIAKATFIVPIPIVV